jgi:uncharacterized membrane protein YfcA
MNKKQRQMTVAELRAEEEQDRLDLVRDMEINAQIQARQVAKAIAVPEFNARRAATQVERAAFNSKMRGFLSFEVCVSAFTAGAYYDSIGVGLGVFVALLALFTIRKTQQSLAFFFSAAWTVAAFALLRAIDPQEPVAWFIAGAFAFAVSIGAHYCFFQWQKDFE